MNRDHHFISRNKNQSSIQNPRKFHQHDGLNLLVTIGVLVWRNATHFFRWLITAAVPTFNIRGNDSMPPCSKSGKIRKTQMCLHIDYEMIVSNFFIYLWMKVSNNAIVLMGINYYISTMNLGILPGFLHILEHRACETFFMVI